MRTRILIPAIFLFAFAEAQNVAINAMTGVLVSINAPGRPSTIYTNYVYPYWRDSALISDDGYYNGFPMIADAIGFQTVGVFKQSANHAAAGPLPLIKTTNGGGMWTQVNIKVDGVEISSSNHSFIKLSTGRLVISYRVAGVINFAYNDNEDENFTSSATTLSPGVDNLVAQSPVRMVETPEGNILFAYYQIGSNGNPASQDLMRSTDEGETFTYYSQIHTGDSTLAQGAVLGNWRGNEVAIAFTHNTGVDATSKMIAIVRTEVANDGGQYGMFFYSPDGGLTWNTDLVNRDPGSFVDDLGNTIINNSPGLSRHLFYVFLASNSPVDIIADEDSVYVVMGERNSSYGPSLKYTAATLDGAYRNKFDDWRRPTLKKFYNIGGATTDHGYPVFFKQGNSIYVAQYDFSLNPTVPEKASRRELIEIYKLFD